MVLGSSMHPRSSTPSIARPTPRPPAPSSRASSRHIPTSPTSSSSARSSATASSRWRARRVRCRRPWSPTRACSIRCATRPHSRDEQDVDEYERAWHAFRTRGVTIGRRVTPARCGGGSAKSCSGSRRATCSASPTSPRSDASSRRSRRCASAPRSTIVGTDLPFAVIGMGKLGGRELNYASDIDVLFVHEGDTDAAEHTARALLATMSESTVDGIVFRTDANLRPEGRAGRLSRTLDSYTSYYDDWAQTWEFQALIKARPVAGDEKLGEEFLARTRPYVWPERLDPEAVREIRAMKERSEELTTRKGLADRELKRGRGGIRDIEFAVQLLQLVHGRHDPAVRSPNTLDALRRARGRCLRRRPRRGAPRRLVPLPPHRRAPPPALRRAADPHHPCRRAGAHPVWPACSGTATTRAATRSRRSRPTIARARPRCGRSTSDSSSRRSSRRSPARPARSRRRPPRSGSPRSGSPTSSGRAPRCASSRSGSPAGHGSCSSSCP